MTRLFRLTLSNRFLWLVCFAILLLIGWLLYKSILKPVPGDTSSVNQKDADKNGRPRYDLKANNKIMIWQKKSKVTDWIAYVPSSEEESNLVSDGSGTIPGSMQIERFKVGDVSVSITRYRVKVSQERVDGTRKALDEMHRRLENISSEEELTEEDLKRRIEYIQRLLDEIEQTGGVPMEIGNMLIDWGARDSPPTEEESAEAANKVWAVLGERSRYGWVPIPSSTQQSEEQLTKEQSFNDNIIPDSPDEGVLGDDIGRLPEEEIQTPSLESSKAMGEQIHPPGVDWQSPQGVLSEEPSFDEKEVDIPELSEKEMMELLNWLESQYREDLPDERKDEVFFQFIKKLNKNQPHRDNEDLRSRMRKPPHTDEDKHIDEDEGEHEPN